jgi:cytochrome c peroxidase
MQLGSDGLTACASCHFHAGTDHRTRNTLSAGPNTSFDAGSHPNSAVVLTNFPLVDFVVGDDRTSARSVRDDVIDAQGVNRTRLLALVPGQAVEPGRTIRDASFTSNGRNVRQVTGRNSPSVINAVFNFANFWDGRANHFFNGVNPFGIMDVQARVYLSSGAALVPLDLTGNLADNPYVLDNASLASQAVGPPLSDVEMSWIGRSWPEVGRKLLPMRPLALQEVHPSDSRLAVVRHPSGKGLNTTYAAMVRAAFRPEFWNGTANIDGYSQMEQNFSLFFGLAVQLYEATLVSDQTPFDRWLLGDVAALSESADRGRALFFSVGAGCANCHVGAELTGASVSLARAPGEAGLIELMTMGNGGLANYDIGYYNIAVTPTAADLGRGGRAPLNEQSMPLSFVGQHFERATLPFTPLAQPACINDFLADPPTICPPSADTVARQAVNGAFKTPGLRNVELTGPYMHNGSMSSLEQVVEFYARGGDFGRENARDKDIDVAGFGMDPQEVADLVAFLKTLTDPRVRHEAAPFDHPALPLKSGHAGDSQAIAADALGNGELELAILPATGAAGGPAIATFEERLAASISVVKVFETTVNSRIAFVCDRQPVAPVRVRLKAAFKTGQTPDPDDTARLSANEVIFTPADWRTTKFVDLTRVASASGPLPLTLRTSAALSTDPAFTRLAVEDVEIDFVP